MENIDLTKIPTWVLRTQLMSIYGDGKYIETPEYRKAYKEIQSELKRRSTIN